MKALKMMIVVALSIVLSIGLCSCETKSERAQRKIDESIAQAKEAKQKLEATKRQQEIVQWMIDNAE